MELNVNQDVLKAIGAAGSLEEIRAAAVAEAAKQQSSADADAAAKAEAEKTAADAKAAEDANKTYSVKEVIGGREFEFNADSPEELNLMVLNAHRVADAMRQSDPVTAPQVQQAPVTPQKTAAEIEAERVELERKFRLGEVGVKEYIEQSGAVGDYLASQGISVDSLKQTVATNQNNAYVNSWAEAGEQFRNSAAGADWPGGNRNMKQLGLKLMELGLQDADNKLEALTIAYNALKKENLLFENEDAKNATTTTQSTPTATNTRTATTPAAAAAPQQAAPVVQQNPAPAARTSSGIFGLSTGVPENTQTKTEDQTQKQFSIDANADPRQIMEAWKTAMANEGRDPNEAFLKSFAARGR